ncbi:MAG: hypothetical protein ACF8R7_01600 [Phycisphaerales bacterium JB039]
MTFDEDGAGPLPPALFVGGGFGTLGGADTFIIARWDGWQASPVGSGLEADTRGVQSMIPLHDGAGLLPPGLYVGGEIDAAGGAPVNNLARWWAPEWQDVGGGLTSPLAVHVFAQAVFDEDGPSPLPPALFVGGFFQQAGGTPAAGIAKWDGREWSALGDGLSTRLPGRTFPAVYALAVYDDGRGPALYVGGSFDYAAGKGVWNIARWDGSSWEGVGSGLSASVDVLHVFDEDGAGPQPPKLFAGGSFTRTIAGPVGSLYHIGRWDGADWTDVGGWLSDGVISAMQVWDEDGPGPKENSLYIGGTFNALPDLTPVNKVARWDGRDWHRVGEGVSGFGMGTSVSAMAVFDEDGPGPNPGGLYVGGLFYYAGAVETRHIARWGSPLGPRPCAADCDGDGELTFFDFLCFQNLFAFGDTRADCDRDASLTFFDFLCFQNAFAAGCP